MMMLSGGRLMGRAGTALACAGLMVIFLAGVALATDPAETTAGGSGPVP